MRNINKYTRIPMYINLFIQLFYGIIRIINPLNFSEIFSTQIPNPTSVACTIWL